MVESNKTLLELVSAKGKLTENISWWYTEAKKQLTNLEQGENQASSGVSVVGICGPFLVALGYDDSVLNSQAFCPSVQILKGEIQLA